MPILRLLLNCSKLYDLVNISHERLRGFQKVVKHVQPMKLRLGHEAIMLQKLSIMLLNSAPKISYYAFKKMPIIPKIVPLILANNESLRPLS